MKYMIGVNYWGSKAGTEMWAEWDEESVRNDLKVLKEYGVEYLRVFPNWRDFQPVHVLRNWQGGIREYRLHGKERLRDEFGLNEVMMARFAKFLQFAEENGQKFIVSILTGWMSGRLFVPPCVEGLNHITDHESLKWQSRFVRGFVRRFRTSPVIAAWDLGNECNCLSPADGPSDAYMWTNTIRSAILSEDATRPIMSGMHALFPFASPGKWTIQEQGELTDVLTTHPYPSPTVGGDRAPMNTLATTMIPTAQTLYYSGLSGKPAMIQESGTFSQNLGNLDLSAAFMRVSLLSGWAHGSLGYLWWCAHEQTLLDFPPYAWSMIERELGLLRTDFSPKPVACEMKRLHEALDALPFEELPPRKVEALCITTYEQNAYWWESAASAFVLAKQAGFDMNFAFCDGEIPEAELYIVPSASGWACMPKDTYETLLDRVEKGATLYISSAGGQITDFERVTGLRSFGLRNNTQTRTLSFDGAFLPFQSEKEYLLEPLDAEVLARADDGNVLFARHAYGKGTIYYMNLALERSVWYRDTAFKNSDDYPYYKVYQEIGKDILSRRLVKKSDPQVGVTEHKVNDHEWIVVAINYDSVPHAPGLTFPEGAKVETLYGDASLIPSCDMAVIRLTY